MDVEAETSLALAPDQRASFDRLRLLMQIADSAWAFAIFDDGNIRRAVLEALRDNLAPQPFYTIILDQNQVDLIAAIDERATEPTAILNFLALPTNLDALALALEIQRDALALRPQRLVFWLTPAEYTELTEKAPNFLSRLNGIFRFGGAPSRQLDSDLSLHGASSVDWGAWRSDEQNRRRPYLTVGDERERSQHLTYLQRRAEDLLAAAHPDWQVIGDSWYDLAGLHETATPRRWQDAEHAYLEAATAYRRCGQTLAAAEAIYQAGAAANRDWRLDRAQELLEAARQAFDLLEESLERTPLAAAGKADSLAELGDLLSTRGQYEEAERLYRASLRVFEAVGDTREVAVTQSRLGDLLSTRGQYEEAERLYRASLDTLLQAPDPLWAAYVQQQLGDLALRRGRPQDALPLLDAAHAAFSAIGLAHWLPGVEALQARARGETLILDDLLGFVWAARHGDHAAGQRALDICDHMLTLPDWEAVARALHRVLAGEEAAAALATVPELTAEQRTGILTALLAE